MTSNDHTLNTAQQDPLIWMTATGTPTREQKLVCIELVTRLADDGWRITGTVGDPITTLVRQAARAMGGTYTATTNARAAESEIPSADGLVPRVVRDAVAAGACTVGVRVVGEERVLHVHLLPQATRKGLASPVPVLSAVVRRGAGAAGR